MIEYVCVFKDGIWWLQGIQEYKSLLDYLVFGANEVGHPFKYRKQFKGKDLPAVIRNNPANYIINLDTIGSDKELLIQERDNFLNRV